VAPASATAAALFLIQPDGCRAAASQASMLPSHIGNWTEQAVYSYSRKNCLLSTNISTDDLKSNTLALSNRIS